MSVTMPHPTPAFAKLYQRIGRPALEAYCEIKCNSLTDLTTAVERCRSLFRVLEGAREASFGGLPTGVSPQERRRRFAEDCERVSGILTEEFERLAQIIDAHEAMVEEWEKAQIRGGAA